MLLTLFHYVRIQGLILSHNNTAHLCIINLCPCYYWLSNPASPLGFLCCCRTKGVPVPNRSGHSSPFSHVNRTTFFEAKLFQTFPLYTTLLVSPVVLSPMGPYISVESIFGVIQEVVSGKHFEIDTQRRC
jgi:hypothetical protein